MADEDVDAHNVSEIVGEIKRRALADLEDLSVYLPKV